MYHTYAIYNSRNKKLYIGQTINIVKRLKEHNRLLPNKSKYAKKYSGLWMLIYSEKYNTRSEAMKREKELKSSRGRFFLKNLVEYEKASVA